jgi:four helix bundle protein
MPRDTTTYQDLKVWQASVDFAILIYRITAAFPREERFALTTQLRKAAVSVSSNIAEGWGRGTTREFRNRCGIARGELKEVESDLVIAERLGYAKKAPYGKARDSIVVISKMLTAIRAGRSTAEV